MKQEETNAPLQDAAVPAQAGEVRRADLFMRLRHLPQTQLPLGIAVLEGKTPSGGVFTVAQFTDAAGMPCDAQTAAKIELYECDYRGRVLFCTHMGKKESV